MKSSLCLLCVLLCNSDWAAPVVRLTTKLDVIEAELFTDQAPVIVTNFLKYVDAGRYTNGAFPRTVKLNPDNQPTLL